MATRVRLAVQGKQERAATGSEKRSANGRRTTPRKDANLKNVSSSAAFAFESNKSVPLCCCSGTSYSSLIRAQADLRRRQRETADR